MSYVSLFCLALLAPGADKDAPEKKPAPAAKVVITADLACMHCNFGKGDHCAACLALDDKTPVLLEGKAGKEFLSQRFDKKVLVAEGVLSYKDKQLVLTSDSAHILGDQDKGKSPEKGLVRITGQSCCAHCDLGIGEDCAVGIKNAASPVVLKGKLAAEHAEEGKTAKLATSTGKLSIDAKGVLWLEAKELTLEKNSK